MVSTWGIPGCPSKGVNAVHDGVTVLLPGNPAYEGLRANERCAVVVDKATGVFLSGGISM